MEQIAQINIPSRFGSPFGVNFGLSRLVAVVLRNAFVAAGVILLFLLVFGGISMIAGAGRGDPEAAARGRSAATAGVIGFVIIFASYLIILVIERLTGVSITNVPF